MNSIIRRAASHKGWGAWALLAAILVLPASGLPVAAEAQTAAPAAA
jgi:hypothetical protein